MAPSLEIKIIAFIDILGFKHLWENNQNLAIQTLHEIRNENASNNNFKNINVSSFSDNIIISTDDLSGKTSLEITDIMHSFLGRIDSFCLYHLQHGVPLRGAISIGSIYQNKDILGEIVAGNAINESVEIEKNLAIFPRVIITKSLLDYIKKLELKEQNIIFNIGISMDFDGLYFVDYLSTPISSSIENIDDFYNILLNIRSRIHENLLAQKNALRKFTKWCWLANYYNNKIGTWNTNYPEKIIKKFNLQDDYYNL